MTTQPGMTAGVATGAGRAPVALTEWIKRHAVTAFLVAAYLWAWLLWGYWVPAMGAEGLELSAGFLACALIGGLAPTLAAVAVSAVVSGRAGVRSLLRQAVHWRAPLWSYAVALLLVPALTVVSLVAQSGTVADLAWDDLAGIIPLAIGWPIMAALGEEFGWRGFALPRLQARYGGLAAALILGVMWGFWHLPADYVGLKGLGWWFFPAFLVGGPLVLSAHSVIMTWLYNRSGRRFPLMLVYHFSITASAILTPTVIASDAVKVLSPLITAALLWAVALSLAVVRRRDFPAALSNAREVGSSLRRE